MSTPHHQAVVLCAGRGCRLRPLTEDLPKCLLSLGGRTILDRCLSTLRGAGIDDVVIVTGYRRDLVEAHVRERGFTRARFVINDGFADTNTAVSLRLALGAVDADFVLVNGDVLFHPGILAALLRHPFPDAVAVDREIDLDSEEVKVIASNGVVERIGKDLDLRRCLGEAIGLCKIGRGLIPVLEGIYTELERRGERRHFFEKGFDLAGPAAGRFGIVFTDGRPWVEIDTPDDLGFAERVIVPRLDG